MNLLVVMSQIQAKRSSQEEQPNVDASFVSEGQKEEPDNSTDNSDDIIYQNLAIPVKQLPAYIQKMKERGDGFQKEFQVSHCYVCL